MKRKFYIFYFKGIEFIIQNLSTKNMPDGFSGEFFPTCLFLSERHKRHIHTFLCLYITVYLWINFPLLHASFI